MASYAAAVRTANSWSQKLREEFPDVVSVTAKLINQTDAAIYVGVCTQEVIAKLPTQVPALDEKDKESKEKIPLMVEFVGGAKQIHR